jgi:hypothetical protein
MPELLAHHGEQRVSRLAAAPKTKRGSTPIRSKFSEDLTMVHGAHQFGFGANIARWDSFSEANVPFAWRRFTFDGSVTGIPMADFLDGQT